jgi:hypothetical protein
MQFTFQVDIASLLAGCVRRWCCVQYTDADSVDGAKRIGSLLMLYLVVQNDWVKWPPHTSCRLQALFDADALRLMHWHLPHSISTKACAERR